MTRSRKWSVIVTLLVIFVSGVVVGLWFTRPEPVKVTLSQPPVPYEALESSEAVVMRVYRELSPTVVNILTTSQALNFWLQVVPQMGQGTGFVIDPEGHIITNNHVVANAENIEVTFVGEKKLKARLVGRDAVSDLAVIKVNPFSDMAVAPLGNSENLSVGQRVIAIGNPFGFQHTVTSGFISALNRDLVVGRQPMHGMIQTDAAINPGNSGGPLMNSKGEVIGINTAIYSQTGSSIGIGLALPINRAKKVAGQILKYGRPIHPWLGVLSWTDMEPALAKGLGLPPVRGVLVVQIAPGSPADRAGLRAGLTVSGGRALVYRGRPIVPGGDVILSVDDVPTPTFDDYRNVILQKNVGDQVRLTVLRGQQEFNVNMTLVEDPRIHK